MKVNIEVQTLCTERDGLSGIPSYTINLIRELQRRNNNDYSVSFYDYKSKYNYRKRIKEYIGDCYMHNIAIHECNSLNYNSIFSTNAAGYASLYNSVPYGELTGADADVYHFPFSRDVLYNVHGGMVVTVHDIIPLLPCYDSTSLWAKKSFENAVQHIKEREEITVITVSQSAKADLCSYCDISPKRVHTVPNGYDATVNFPEQNRDLLKALGIDGPYLLYLGELGYRKGLTDILSAFSIIKPKYKGLKLVFAGSFRGYPLMINKINDTITDLRLQNDIIFPGYVSNEQKRVLMSSAEIFLYPSEYEGFGIPVLEAMACGSPVITTNVSSLPEVGGDAALYVSPNNPDQLASEIGRLLSSDSLCDECRQRGFKRVGQFSWERTAEMTEDVYKIAYECRTEKPCSTIKKAKSEEGEQGEDLPLILYGAGQNAQYAYHRVRENGLNPVAFIDKDSNKWGKPAYSDCPLTVISLEEAKRKYDDFEIYITIGINNIFKYSVYEYIIEENSIRPERVLNFNPRRSPQ